MTGNTRAFRSRANQDHRDTGVSPVRGSLARARRPCHGTPLVANFFNRWKAISVLTTVLATALIALSCQNKDGSSAPSSSSSTSARATDNPRAAQSRQAFLAAYAVFMHPRCMNCHPVGDQPLQGDDSHIHTQNVQRGTDGKGLYALKCANCHQPENLPGLHMPPGNPNWHLPPADMKMIFQGKSPAELARQLKDPNFNGHKTLDQILVHVTEDPLVKSGWTPGDGRALPPLSHEQFAAKMREWVETGAVDPE